MVGCQYSRTREHLRTYRGVFIGLFDFDLTSCYAGRADLREKYGLQLTEEQIHARERIRKLEILGGIQGPIDLKDVKKELQDFLDSKN